MENKKRTLKEDAKLVLKGIGIWQKILPSFVPYLICASITSCVLPYFPLYMSAEIINELAGSCDLNRLLLLAAITVVGTFALSVLNRFLTGGISVDKIINQRNVEALLNRLVAFIYRIFDDIAGLLLCMKFLCPLLRCGKDGVILPVIIALRQTVRENLHRGFRFRGGGFRRRSAAVRLIAAGCGRKKKG